MMRVSNLSANTLAELEMILDAVQRDVYQVPLRVNTDLSTVEWQQLLEEAEKIPPQASDRINMVKNERAKAILPRHTSGASFPAPFSQQPGLANAHASTQSTQSSALPKLGTGFSSTPSSKFSATPVTAAPPWNEGDRSKIRWTEDTYFWIIGKCTDAEEQVKGIIATACSHALTSQLTACAPASDIRVKTYTPCSVLPRTMEGTMMSVSRVLPLGALMTPAEDEAKYEGANFVPTLVVDVCLSDSMDWVTDSARAILVDCPQVRAVWTVWISPSVFSAIGPGMPLATIQQQLGMECKLTRRETSDYDSCIVDSAWFPMNKSLDDMLAYNQGTASSTGSSSAYGDSQFLQFPLSLLFPNLDMPHDQAQFQLCVNASEVPATLASYSQLLGNWSRWKFPSSSSSKFGKAASVAPSKVDIQATQDFSFLSLPGASGAARATGINPFATSQSATMTPSTSTPASVKPQASVSTMDFSGDDQFEIAEVDEEEEEDEFNFAMTEAGGVKVNSLPSLRLLLEQFTIEYNANRLPELPQQCETDLTESAWYRKLTSGASMFGLNRRAACIRWQDNQMWLVELDSSIVLQAAASSITEQITSFLSGQLLEMHCWTDSAVTYLDETLRQNVVTYPVGSWCPSPSSEPSRRTFVLDIGVFRSQDILIEDARRWLEKCPDIQLVMLLHLPEREFTWEHMPMSYTLIQRASPNSRDQFSFLPWREFGVSAPPTNSMTAMTNQTAACTRPGQVMVQLPLSLLFSGRTLPPGISNASSIAIDMYAVQQSVCTELLTKNKLVQKAAFSLVSPDLIPLPQRSTRPIRAAPSTVADNFGNKRHVSRAGGAIPLLPLQALFDYHFPNFSPALQSQLQDTGNMNEPSLYDMSQSIGGVWRPAAIGQILSGSAAPVPISIGGSAPAAREINRMSPSCNESAAVGGETGEVEPSDTDIELIGTEMLPSGSNAPPANSTAPPDTMQ